MGNDTLDLVFGHTAATAHTEAGVSLGDVVSATTSTTPIIFICLRFGIILWRFRTLTLLFFAANLFRFHPFLVKIVFVATFVESVIVNLVEFFGTRRKILLVLGALLLELVFLFLRKLCVRELDRRTSSLQTSASCINMGITETSCLSHLHTGNLPASIVICSEYKPVVFFALFLG